MNMIVLFISLSVILCVAVYVFLIRKRTVAHVYLENDRSVQHTWQELQSLQLKKLWIKTIENVKVGKEVTNNYLEYGEEWSLENPFIYPFALEIIRSHGLTIAEKESAYGSYKPFKLLSYPYWTATKAYLYVLDYCDYEKKIHRTLADEEIQIMRATFYLLKTTYVDDSKEELPKDRKQNFLIGKKLYADQNLGNWNYDRLITWR
jgi:hypothetical protein